MSAIVHEVTPDVEGQVWSAVALERGWRLDRSPDSMESDWVGPDGIRGWPPNWTKSLDACIADLVPEAEERDWTWTLWHPDGFGTRNWWCSFRRFEKTIRDVHRPFARVTRHADTPTLAFCLAWLETRKHPEPPSARDAQACAGIRMPVDRH